MNGLIKQCTVSRIDTIWKYMIAYSVLPIILTGNGNANAFGYVTSAFDVTTTQVHIDPSYGATTKGAGYMMLIGY